jgi:hypothetical protein
MNLAEVAARSLKPFSFRGKGRLLNSLCEKTGTRRTTLFGYQIDLSLDDHIQRNVYLGTYEQHDSALVRRYLKPGMTFVDVGANISRKPFATMGSRTSSWNKRWGMRPAGPICSFRRRAATIPRP